MRTNREFTSDAPDATRLKLPFGPGGGRLAGKDAAGEGTDVDGFLSRAPVLGDSATAALSSAGEGMLGASADVCGRGRGARGARAGGGDGVRLERLEFLVAPGASGMCD